MIILNVTKFASYAPHYYCSFYRTTNAFVSLESIQKMKYDISDRTIYKSLEQEYGNDFSPIKSDNEKDLFNEAIKVLKAHFSYIQLVYIIVFSNGRFCYTRTKLINDIHNMNN